MIFNYNKINEASSGFEPLYKLLQSSAYPLGHDAKLNVKINKFS